MFENKVFEACAAVLLAVSFAYFGVRTIHEWENVRARRWDVAQALEVNAEYYKGGK